MSEIFKRIYQIKIYSPVHCQLLPRSVLLWKVQKLLNHTHYLLPVQSTQVIARSPHSLTVMKIR